MAQIWRHGAKDHHGEDLRLHLLSERRAGHRSSGSCHRVQLQPNLPPEPESREETSTEGDEHKPKLPVTSQLTAVLGSVCRKITKSGSVSINVYRSVNTEL